MNDSSSTRDASSGPAPDKAAQPDGLEAPRRHWAVAVTLVGITLTTLDSSMLNVALPTIAQDLDINPGKVMWVVIASSLTILVSLLPLLAVAERIGFRRMFALGVTVFMFSALACSLSTSFAGLVTARVTQGIGTSMLMCLFGGLVRNIYPMRMMGFGISLNSLSVGVMAVIGPTVGAFILEVANWRWIFASEIPLCLVLYPGVRFLPDVSRVWRRFDWQACLLSMIMFGLAIVGLDVIAQDPLHALLSLAGAGVAGALLLHWSRGQTSPMVPIDLLRVQPVAFAVAASLCSFAAQMGSFVALPFYFIEVLGYSYAQVGVLAGVWSIGTAAMAPLSGYLSDRYKVAVLCAIGAACMAVGLFWVIVLPEQAGIVWHGLGMLLGGLGFGFFQSPNNRALLVGAPRHRSGAAGALQATTRVFGQSLGTALVAIAFNLGGAQGALVGVIVAACCALAALAVNITRYFNPAPDAPL